MTALTYTDCLGIIATLIPTETTDTNLLAIFPQAINDAELRLYRDLDLLNTVVRDSSATLSTGTRTFQLPSTLGTFVVVDEFNVITPAGTSNPESGTRVGLAPTTKEMLDFLWPSSTGSTTPVYFARISDQTAIVGPWPDSAYQMEVVGTIHPASLSPTNTTTLLSVYFPDIFIAALMVFISGYMKNYGAAVDDPQQGVTWNTHYNDLLKGATVEEQRKKFAGGGWSSDSPNPLATPPRT